MLNPPEISIGRNGSSCDVRRYQINLQTGSVTSSEFPNQINNTYSRYMEKFDFATINEAYRGKEVSIPECLFKNELFIL